MIGTDLNLVLPELEDTLADIVAKTATALAAIEDSIADAATVAALDIQTALPLNGNALTEVTYIQFVEGNAPDPAIEGSIYYSDGAWYVVDSTGPVRIVEDGALTISSVGAIGGDYTSVGALVDFDNITDTYRFRQQIATAVRQYAKLRAGDLQLVEYKAAGDASVPSNAVTLKSPAALAASYAVTMPAALPGSQVAVQLQSDGDLVASNTFSDIVATGGVQAATLEASTNIVHTFQHRRSLSMFSAHKSGTVSVSTIALTAASAANILMDCELNQGDQARAVEFYVTKADTQLTYYELWYRDASSETVIDSISSDVAGAQTLDFSISPGFAVVGEAEQLFVKVTMVTGDVLRTVCVLWDRPA